MNYLTVKTKELNHIIKATFPGYRKREVIVYPTAHVTFHDLNWGGGTRSEYRACTIDGKPIDNRYDMSAPAPWHNPFEGKTIDLPVGAVIVQAGTFCGKPATAFIHVHPDNMPKLLTA